MSVSLLAEVIVSRQNEHGFNRHWYTSDDMELIVWKDSMSGELVCFHLCSMVDNQEMLFSWDSEHGATYTPLEVSRENVLQYPQSPLLSFKAFNIPESLVVDFTSKSSGLDSELAAHILSKISSDL